MPLGRRPVLGNADLNVGQVHRRPVVVGGPSRRNPPGMKTDGCSPLFLWLSGFGMQVAVVRVQLVFAGWWQTCFDVQV